MFYVIGQFIKIMFQGFVAGLVVRFIIAVAFRNDATIKGFLRTGLVFAILNLILVLGRIYYIW
jgi:hypothetical protein